MASEASHRPSWPGGEGEHTKKCRVATLAFEAGWWTKVRQKESFEQPPRLRGSRKLRDFFLIAQPPLLSRRGDGPHHFGCGAGGGEGCAPLPLPPCAGVGGGSAGIVAPPSSVNVNSRLLGFARASTEKYCFPSSI